MTGKALIISNTDNWHWALESIFLRGTVEEQTYTPESHVGYDRTADQLAGYDTLIINAHHPERPYEGANYARKLREQGYKGHIIMVYYEQRQGTGRSVWQEMDFLQREGIINRSIHQDEMSLYNGLFRGMVIEETNARRAEVEAERKKAAKAAAEHDPAQYPELRAVIGAYGGDMFIGTHLETALKAQKLKNRHFDVRMGTLPPYNLRLNKVKECDVLIVDSPDDPVQTPAALEALQALRDKGFKGKIVWIEANKYHGNVDYCDDAPVLHSYYHGQPCIDLRLHDPYFKADGKDADAIAGLAFARNLEKKREASFKDWPLPQNQRRLASDEKLWPSRLRLSDQEIEGLDKAVRKKALAPIREYTINPPRFQYAAFAKELQGEWDAQLQKLLEAKGRWKDGKPRAMTDDEALEMDAERAAHAKERQKNKAEEDAASKALTDHQARENAAFDRRRWDATADTRPYRYFNFARLESERTRLGMRGFRLEEEALERVHKRRPIVPAGMPLTALKPAEKQAALARDAEWQKHQATLAALEAEYALRNMGGREESYNLDDHAAGRAPAGAPVDMRLMIERPTQQDKDHTQRLLKERDVNRTSNPGGPRLK